MLGLLPSGWRLAVILGGLAAILALGVALWFQIERNGMLKVQLANAQAVIDQREQDAKDNAKAVAQLAEKLSTTEAKVITITEKVYQAPVTKECSMSPSMRAASDGIKQMFGK